MTKERGGGREREGESNFKTKDRLGDNEWCKPEDLLVSAERSHSLIRGPLFLFSSPSLSLSIYLSALHLSPSWPDRLIKTEKKTHLCGPKMFLLHLIMERKV